MAAVGNNYADPFCLQVDSMTREGRLPHLKFVNQLIKQGIAVLEAMESERDRYFRFLSGGAQADPAWEAQFCDTFENLISAGKKLLNAGVKDFGVDGLPGSLKRLRKALERLEGNYPFTPAQEARIPEIGLSSGISTSVIDEGLKASEEGRTVSREEMFRRIREARAVEG